MGGRWLQSGGPCGSFAFISASRPLSIQQSRAGVWKPLEPSLGPSSQCRLLGTRLPSG